MKVHYCDLCRAKCNPHEKVPHWAHGLSLSYAAPDCNREGWERGVTDCCHACARHVWTAIDGILAQLRATPKEIPDEA